jgi:mycofactocin precursor
MSNVLQTKDAENKNENLEPEKKNHKASDPEILNTVDIHVEEVAIDGICGVY